MATEISKYGIHPIIKIDTGHATENGDKIWFSFGYKKAKLIVENIEDIKAFVKENDNKNDTFKKSPPKK